MKEYGLIGCKLSHSFSADFFTKKFRDEKIDSSYSLFPLVSITDLPALIESKKNLEGLNVTIPYKEEVIPFLDELSEEANQIGAVNVIKIRRKNNQLLLKGFNTDSIGFHNSIKPMLRDDVKAALILGTGGASKAVEYVLKQLGIKTTFVSRKGRENGLTYPELNESIIKDNLLIINTTPLGTYPDVEECPPIPYSALTPQHICYDLVYNPEQTLFLKNAAKYEASTKNGLEMLYLQALAAWDIWNS